jgi:hypothetical protein
MLGEESPPQGVPIAGLVVVYCLTGRCCCCATGCITSAVGPDFHVERSRTNASPRDHGIAAAQVVTEAAAVQVSPGVVGRWLLKILTVPPVAVPVASRLAALSRERWTYGRQFSGARRG